MGVCFVGSVPIKTFLKNYIQAEEGPIVDQNGIEVGRHDGATFYTIGQRHGLNVGGGLPFYVTKKDVENNIVYVTTKIDDATLWTKTLSLVSCHMIGGHMPEMELTIRLRHLGPLINISSFVQKNDHWRLSLRKK